MFDKGLSKSRDVASNGSRLRACFTATCTRSAAAVPASRSRIETSRRPTIGSKPHYRVSSGGELRRGDTPTRKIDEGFA